MKNYRIILGSFIVSALFLSSCQDIDLLPKDNMPDELFWKTPTVSFPNSKIRQPSTRIRMPYGTLLS